MSTQSIVIKTRAPKKFKVLTAGQYLVDRNTPCGEPADYYEIKPFGGRKLVEPLAFIDGDKVSYDRYRRFDYERNVWVANPPKELQDFVNYATNKSNSHAAR